MKDFDINNTYSYNLGWIDNVTFVSVHDLADDKDDNGEPLKAWLEAEYHADEKRIVFQRCTENYDGGSFECENIERNQLTKEQYDYVYAYIEKASETKLEVA